MRKATAVRSMCTTTRESPPRNEDSAQPKITFLKKLARCNFPSSPVVRTPLIQCSRCEFDPGSGNEDSPLAGWHSRKRKKCLKKKKVGRSSKCDSREDSLVWLGGDSCLCFKSPAKPALSARPFKSKATTYKAEIPWQTQGDSSGCPGSWGVHLNVR